MLNLMPPSRFARFQHTESMVPCVVTSRTHNPWHRSPSRNDLTVSLVRPLRALTPGQVRGGLEGPRGDWTEAGRTGLDGRRLRRDELIWTEMREQN